MHETMLCAYWRLTGFLLLETKKTPTGSILVFMNLDGTWDRVLGSRRSRARFGSIFAVDLGVDPAAAVVWYGDVAPLRHRRRVTPTVSRYRLVAAAAAAVAVVVQHGGPAGSHLASRFHLVRHA